jgi:hypothetical protein
MLHQIIDALPEERLQNVERVLQYEGITPIESGRIPDEMAARIREQLAKLMGAESRQALLTALWSGRGVGRVGTEELFRWSDR